VVKVSGKGTSSFLNNKLSNTFPQRINKESTRHQIGAQEVKVDTGVLTEAGLLTSKGRMIDKLSVATFPSDDGIEAYMITSPGHAGSQLFNRLDPFIFPLDGVKLVDMCPTQMDKTKTKSRVFTLAATKIETVQNCINQSVLPIFNTWSLDSFFSFPTNEKECRRYTLSSVNGGEIQFVIFEQTFLPTCISRGYTVIISDIPGKGDDQPSSLGSAVWERCTSEANFNGPVSLGPLEYETLRIEGGQPGFGCEMMGHLKDSDDVDDVKNTKVGPLELYLDNVVDVSKGCYQGQEGVAALLKNKRGLPRNLYSVSFPEEDNFYEGQEDQEEYSSQQKYIPNETKLPKVGDDIYVLGSNQQIKVGTLTSVGERGGTSLPETVGMALVRRAEPILKKMKEMDIELERNVFIGQGRVWGDTSSVDDGSGIIMPPPLDPLDGLEVVLGNGFTRGLLRVIPRRRLRLDQNLFDVEQWSIFDDEQDDAGPVMDFMPNESVFQEDEVLMEMDIVSEIETESIPSLDNDEAGIDDMDDVDDEELQAAIEAAKIAADEVRRTEEKLAKLKERAEEAIKKRKEAKEAGQNQAKKETEVDAGEEEKRKAEKMEMLKKRAEEALARRRKKQE